MSIYLPNLSACLKTHLLWSLSPGLFKFIYVGCVIFFVQKPKLYSRGNKIYTKDRKHFCLLDFSLRILKLKYIKNNIASCAIWL